MQARIEEVTAVDTLTLHECHGRYPQASSVEDFRAIWLQCSSASPAPASVSVVIRSVCVCCR